MEIQIQQDKHSGTVWGSNKQLTIIGHYRLPNKNDKYFHKVYILECEVCSKDKELFPVGSITCSLGNLRGGKNPCQCYIHTVWKEYQYVVLVKRAAAHIGVEFIGWDGEYKRSLSRARVMCPKHGEYTTGVLSDFLIRNYGCPYCKGDAVRERVRKSDTECIESFIKSGAFHPNTKFWRSARKDKSGYEYFWYMDCPECGEIGEGYRVNLERGHKPCGCAKGRQKQAYINLICDGEAVIAIKFGIAVKFQDRVVKQNRKSVYEIKNYGVWEFETTLECSQAEKDCRVNLKCKVIPKGEMIDGHSETTYIMNLEEVIDIYERNGGVRIFYEN